jgi:phosphate transport system substrate-binding protein
MAADQAKRLKGWLDYAEGDGQAVAGELQYAKLPSALHTKAAAKVNGLTCNGQPIAGT